MIDEHALETSWKKQREKESFAVILMTIIYLSL